MSTLVAQAEYHEDNNRKPIVINSINNNLSHVTFNVKQLNGSTKLQSFIAYHGSNREDLK